VNDNAAALRLLAADGDTRCVAVDQARAAGRLTHIDLLRVALTIGVIATHAVITYGAEGSWFYQEGSLPDAPVERPLRPRLLVARAAFVAVASFAFRIVFEVDSYQMGAAHIWQWGQCIGLFALGVLAGRQGRLIRIPPGIGRACRRIPRTAPTSCRRRSWWRSHWRCARCRCRAPPSC
jgi:peptidoglycan/LPS O-acetylase OafA/YrhL